MKKQNTKIMTIICLGILGLYSGSVYADDDLDKRMELALNGFCHGLALTVFNYGENELSVDTRHWINIADDHENKGREISKKITNYDAFDNGQLFGERVVSALNIGRTLSPNDVLTRYSKNCLKNDI